MFSGVKLRMGSFILVVISSIKSFGKIYHTSYDAVGDNGLGYKTPHSALTKSFAKAKHGEIMINTTRLIYNLLKETNETINVA